MWLLIICASLLWTSFAAVAAAAATPTSTGAASSVFPMAVMDLNLTFDLSSLTLAEDSEQCFPFFPNAPYQGESFVHANYNARLQ